MQLIQWKEREGAVMHFIYLGAIVLGFSCMIDGNNYTQGCYYTNWAQYRPGAYAFVPEDIDPSLCTHIFYGFANLVNHVITPYEWNDESTQWSPGMFERVNDLKEAHPHLKTLLSVGGWSTGTESMTAMLATHGNRKIFIDHSIAYLRRWNFDGLDLAFMYPGDRGSPPEDKQRYTLLCQELKAAYEAEAIATGNPTLLLAATVSAQQNIINNGYEISSIAPELDIINVMTYDYNGAGFNLFRGANHGSPLYHRQDEVPAYENANVKWSVDYWNANGAPREKINIGVLASSNGYTLVNIGDNGFNAPSIGNSPAGDIVGAPGDYAVFEDCRNNNAGTMTRVFDEESQVAYYHGLHVSSGSPIWVGYEDVEGLNSKVDFIRSEGYGGYFVMSMDLDDFDGTDCQQGRYPLLGSLNTAINN